MLWLKILLKELGFEFNDSMRLYWDNKATINIAHIQFNITKPSMLKLTETLSCTQYVKTWEQRANILTKEVSSIVLHLVLCKLSMRDIFALT